MRIRRKAVRKGSVLPVNRTMWRRQGSLCWWGGPCFARLWHKNSAVLTVGAYWALIKNGMERKSDDHSGNDK